MKTFHSLKELIQTLYRERDLLDEMFQKRKSLLFQTEDALGVLDHDAERLQALVQSGVLRNDSTAVEFDELYLDFFEQVLSMSEEINVSQIDENLEALKEHMIYFLQEEHATRREKHLRSVKLALRRIGATMLRNVIDMRRNVENTFTIEPNWRVKQTKLENLAKKRNAIYSLIVKTEKLLEEERAFFKNAIDGNLNFVLLELREQMNDCRHSLIEIQRQIIDFLSQIRQQSQLYEKLRKIKYLKDQFELESQTNIAQVMEQKNALVFDTAPRYPLNLSIDELRTSDQALEVIRRLQREGKQQKLVADVAPPIDLELLNASMQEEGFISHDELLHAFLAQSDDLFSFVRNYRFEKPIGFDEQITLFCQLISEYDYALQVTDQTAVYRVEAAFSKTSSVNLTKESKDESMKELTKESTKRTVLPTTLFEEERPKVFDEVEYVLVYPHAAT